MNVADTELVCSILSSSGHTIVSQEDTADVVLLNTCAIRDKAEAKIWGKLQLLAHEQKVQQRKRTIGLLGCMAERLKDKLLTSGLVDIIAGPDAYRDLPKLLGELDSGASHAMNVQLSLEETYADIAPTRAAGAAAAFVSITRGCNNMCSFCIVPFTRRASVSSCTSTRWTPFAHT